MLPREEEPQISVPMVDIRIRADGLKWSSGEDEMAHGRRRMTLDFILPRGSYATILIKRITVAGRLIEDEEPVATPDDEQPAGHDV